ncbi:bifunctional DNA primase/polymerase [Amycolatopsis sp. WQ 127309]|uniref:bifunctional DNA primase/polymerase n=1 Tax=Amycolatopsis sp. WQ 127309 TaxID=2932773 RepID=UPI001FF5C872|nr:bifunctional DNA primase/polymerase [Amycolatopsis sp. WQ 127309]UOZ10529.1 bifunctional DNA primase/polymerase [Amycolatopsis sp. WQ 127309]
MNSTATTGLYAAEREQLLRGYAARGMRLVPIFEVRPDGSCACGDPHTGPRYKVGDIGKHPRLKEWPATAVADAAQLVEWHRQWPTSNWAWVLDNHFVVDLDPRNGAPLPDELDDVELARIVGCTLPQARRQLTGGGGLHIVLRQPTGEPIHNGKLYRDGRPIPGFDIKGVGGYVLVEPSNHRSGDSYRWVIDDGTDAIAPAELVASTHRTRETPDRTGDPADRFHWGEWAAEGKTLIGGGQREHLLRGVGAMLERGDELERIIFEALSVAQTYPTLDPADPWSEDYVVDFCQKRAKEWGFGQGRRIPLAAREWLDTMEVEEALRPDLEKRIVRDRVDELFRQYKASTAADGWIDVAEIVAAGVEPPAPPSVLEFADDAAVSLFYAGRYNAVFGDYSVGKSLLLAETQARFIMSGQHVVHLEYDNNSPAAVVWRLYAAGATPEQVAEFLHMQVNVSEIGEMDFEPALMTLDSVNPAIGTFDVDPNSSSRGVDLMVKHLIEPFTERGATVISLDHVGNASQDRPSNNRRKLQAVQGAVYKLDREGSAGRDGVKWMSRLVVKKDNPGRLAASVDDVAGFAVFDGSVPGEGTVRTSLWRTPVAELAAAHAAVEIPAKDHVLRIVSQVSQGGITAREVCKTLADEGIDVKLVTVRHKLTELYDEGKIAGEQRGKSKTATWHYLAAGLSGSLS